MGFKRTLSGGLVVHSSSTVVSDRNRNQSGLMSSQVVNSGSPQISHGRRDSLPAAKLNDYACNKCQPPYETVTWFYNPNGRG